MPMDLFTKGTLTKFIADYRAMQILWLIESFKAPTRSSETTARLRRPGSGAALLLPRGLPAVSEEGSASPGLLLYCCFRATLGGDMVSKEGVNFSTLHSIVTVTSLPFGLDTKEPRISDCIRVLAEDVYSEDSMWCIE